MFGRRAVDKRLRPRWRGSVLERGRRPGLLDAALRHGPRRPQRARRRKRGQFHPSLQGRAPALRDPGGLEADRAVRADGLQIRLQSGKRADLRVFPKKPTVEGEVAVQVCVAVAGNFGQRGRGQPDYNRARQRANRAALGSERRVAV